MATKKNGHQTRDNSNRRTPEYREKMRQIALNRKKKLGGIRTKSLFTYSDLKTLTTPKLVKRTTVKWLGRITVTEIYI